MNNSVNNPEAFRPRSSQVASPPPPVCSAFAAAHLQSKHGTAPASVRFKRGEGPVNPLRQATHGGRVLLVLPLHPPHPVIISSERVAPLVA